MAEAGDFILVYFLEEQPLGKQFARKRNDWPLHITLVPWFTVDDEANLREVLELSARYSPKLTVEVGEEVQFNPETRVNVIADQQGVAMLHGALLATLQEMDVVLRNTQWTNDNYTAHITHHQNQLLPKNGDLLDMDTFSLVRLLPENRCEVVQHFSLGAVL